MIATLGEESILDMKYLDIQMVIDTRDKNPEHFRRIVMCKCAIRTMYL